MKRPSLSRSVLAKGLPTPTALLLAACLLFGLTAKPTLAQPTSQNTASHTASSAESFFPAGTARPYMRQQTVDGMTLFTFFERAPYTWQRNKQGQPTGLCLGQRCLSFLDCIAESCPKPVLNIRQNHMVTLLCQNHVPSPTANIDQPQGNALGTGLTRPQSSPDPGITQGRQPAEKITNASLSATIKELWAQCTLDNCLQLLNKANISSEWLRKGLSAFMALGLLVYIIIILAEVIDHLGNALLNAGANALHKIWQRYFPTRRPQQAVPTDCIGPNMPPKMPTSFAHKVTRLYRRTYVRIKKAWLNK